MVIHGRVELRNLLQSMEQQGDVLAKLVKISQKIMFFSQDFLEMLKGYLESERSKNGQNSSLRQNVLKEIGGSKAPNFLFLLTY